MPNIILWALIGLVVGAVVGYIGRKYIAQNRKETIESEIQEMREEAEQEAKQIKLEAREKSVEILEDAKEEAKEHEKKLSKKEERLGEKEERLEKKEEEVESEKEKLQQEKQKTQELKEELENQKQEKIQKLAEVSELDQEEAKEQLFEELEESYEQELYKRLEKLEEEGQETLEERAKNIMALAMQRLASEHTSEIASYNIDLPSEDMKGRIIGKDGRNIRAFERETGVEVVIDDSPEVVTLSSFNPVRREIARVAMERLIEDGRIQPSRIEDFVDDAKEEVGSQIIKAGKDATYELGIVGIDPELEKVLGRLKFRTSYGQNVLEHSIEVAKLAKIIAEELNADVQVAKKAGLFHDIGKTVDNDVQGTHVEIGMRILDKYGVEQEVIDAMKSHHGEFEVESVEALIVEVADAISGSRPGARQQSMEEYLQRLEDLEKTASSFDGVEKAYAINAGREVRVFVRPEEIGDAKAKNLARDIANTIEEEITYPGEIKVNVIRENRIAEYAR